MYWLFGGSPKTFPGFVVGALIGGLVAFATIHIDKGLTAIIMIFSGMTGETVHHYYRTRSR